MDATIHNTIQWDLARSRARDRDDGRCTVSRLLGGPCASGTPHVHHIHAVREGGAAFDLDNLATVCAVHHPMWESLRRILVRRMLAASEPIRCRHEHRTAEARRICEQRIARQRQLVA